MGEHLFRDAPGARKGVPAHEHGHRPRIAGQKHGFLGGGEPAAHHEHVPPGEEFAVACGAVGHTPAPEFCFAPEADLTRMRAGRDHHGEAPQDPPAGPHELDVALDVQPLHLGEQELGAETLRLPPHGVGQFPASGPLHAGVVHHLRRDGDLPAEGFFFHDEHPVTGAGQIKGGGQPGGAAAHDDGIVEIVPHYSRPTRSRLGFRVSAPGFHLAGHT